MSKRAKHTFEGTESELLVMTRDLDELHHDVGMPAMRQGVADMVDAMEADVRSTSRGHFSSAPERPQPVGAAMMVVGTPDSRRRDHSPRASVRDSMRARSHRQASTATWRWRRWPPAWRTWLSSPTTPA